MGISATGYQWNTDISAIWWDKPLYFKAGWMCKTTPGYTSEDGKVTFSRLDIDHNT